MKAIIVGLGNQGAKRLKVAGDEVVATVDPVGSESQYKTIEQVPLDSFDTGLVCTPEQEKLGILTYLFKHGKHVMVEKPLLMGGDDILRELGASARSTGAAFYTAYNHRFEPHLVRLKEILESGKLGGIYAARMFYGNGTARDVRDSGWRDQELGVLTDLGCHLLDLTLFLFGDVAGSFQVRSANRFETRAFDHVVIGTMGRPALELEMTYLSWRNTFTVDIFGEKGSAHVNGLCKWGPSTLTVRERVLPSGVPHETVETVAGPDPTWPEEYRYFKQLCQTGGSNYQDGQWISAMINDLARGLNGR